MHGQDSASFIDKTRPHARARLSLMHGQDSASCTGKTQPHAWARHSLMHGQDSASCTGKTQPHARARLSLMHGQDSASCTGKTQPHAQARLSLMYGHGQESASCTGKTQSNGIDYHHSLLEHHKQHNCDSLVVHCIARRTSVVFTSVHTLYYICLQMCSLLAIASMHPSLSVCPNRMCSLETRDKKHIKSDKLLLMSMATLTQHVKYNTQCFCDPNSQFKCLHHVRLCINASFNITRQQSIKKGMCISICQSLMFNVFANRRVFPEAPA